jgi:hypothetical protein
MPVDNGNLRLDPYQSQVPLVQIPREDIAPGGPLPVSAGYMGKAGGVAEIVNEGFRGFLRGREIKEQRKTAQANQAIDMSNKQEQHAWESYQDALRTGLSKPGDEKDTNYQAYLKAHQTTSETMEKVAIPEEKPKGQKKKDGGKDKQEGPLQPKSLMDGIKQFAEANPHLIPQALIAARTPNKPMMSADTEQTKNKLTQQSQDIQMGQQTIASNEVKMKEQTEQLQRATQERQIEESGGYDKVLSDPKATPEQKQAASRMKFTVLDKESPEGKMKLGLMNDVQSGANKSWTPGQHQLAGYLGITPEPKMVKITGKNGHEQELLVDPLTNQPVPGSKPLDLGPPAWAQQFYAERAAKKGDLRRAINADPLNYGVQITGDKKTDDARIDAVAMRMFTDHEEGIRSASNSLSKPAYEVTRDNTLLNDVSKTIAGRIPKSGGKDADGNALPGKADFTWPGEKKPVSLSGQDANEILNQFVTNPNGEHPGIYTFRDKPQLQTGKDAGAAERDRQFVHDLVMDRMMAQKGKNAMTKEQAEAYLANTALGKPITKDDVVAQPDQPAQPKGSFRKFIDGALAFVGSGGITTGTEPDQQNAGSMRDGPPSAAGKKVYIINGQAYPMSPEEVEKITAAGYTVEEASSDLQHQFSQ